MKRVIHIDIPRSFTTTIKLFDFDAASYLDKLGILYDSVDINIEFWQFLAAKLGSYLDIEKHFFYPEVCPAYIERLNRSIEEINLKLKIPLSPFGFSFDKRFVYSTSGIEELCRTFEGLETIREFISVKLNPILLQDPLPTVISLGIDSHQALAFAALLTTVLKTMLPPDVRVGIGKHSYENFSLSFWHDYLEESKALNSIFDFIIDWEEHFKESLSELCGVTVPDIPQPSSWGANINTLVAAYTSLIQKSRYREFCGINPEKLVYLVPLSRNKCYWHQCTFCVQSNKHIADRFYLESCEIDIALAIVRVIYDLGIRYIIFSDAAVTPKNVARLCQFLEDEKIEDLQWTVRITASANFSDRLIEQMARLGCREVLFGLETVVTDTAERMRKVSASSSEENLMSLLGQFGDRGIGIFLNLIYGFPTESDDEFLASFRFYQRAKSKIPGITVQFNKFTLFYGSRIFQFPEQYGIEILADESAPDLQLIFDYIDSFGRRYSESFNQEYWLESLEMNLSEIDSIPEDFLDTLFQIKHASFGFIYKCQSNQDLMRYILPAYSM